MSLSQCVEIPALVSTSKLSRKENKANGVFSTSTEKEYMGKDLIGVTDATEAFYRSMVEKDLGN